MLALDLFGIGKIADAVQTGEWIAAFFGTLTWAVGHWATAMWLIGGGIIFSVLRKGWPVSNVPNADTPLGKALLYTGIALLLGGFGWRAADAILEKLTNSPRANSHPSAMTGSPLPGSQSASPSRPDQSKAIP